MKKDDVQHLATLARLDLTEEELDKYTSDLADILGYVDILQKVEIDTKGQVEGTVSRNVFREDDDVHEKGLYTEDLVKAAPKSRDDFIEVKKILNPDGAE